ncbi:MAG TPA: ABC transporter permease [Firmicutes bacterium]|nr:ABC transporter permease [Candidatus Fermentithermobacillaceae bacterium]
MLSTAWNSLLSQSLMKPVVTATGETLAMVLVSLVFAELIGTPLGIWLILSGPRGLAKNNKVYSILSTVVNIGRSIPFVILMVAIIPFTRFVTGTSIGTVAAMVPLSISAIPFVARVTESAMLTVEPGVIDACVSMGASWHQIVRYVLVPECMYSLISGASITAVNLVGYSAMAGAIGGGGLGNLAIRYGYQRWEPAVMALCVAVLIGLVQGIQYAGDSAARRFMWK